MAVSADGHPGERAMRRLLDEHSLPQPDVVQYREASIVLLWDATKTAVVIDLSDGPGERTADARPR